MTEIADIIAGFQVNWLWSNEGVTWLHGLLNGLDSTQVLLVAVLLLAGAWYLQAFAILACGALAAAIAAAAWTFAPEGVGADWRPILVAAFAIAGAGAGWRFQPLRAFAVRGLMIVALLAIQPWITRHFGAFLTPVLVIVTLFQPTLALWGAVATFLVRGLGVNPGLGAWLVLILGALVLHEFTRGQFGLPSRVHGRVTVGQLVSGPMTRAETIAQSLLRRGWRRECVGR